MFKIFSSQTKILEKTLNSMDSELDNLDQKLHIDINQKSTKYETNSENLICWKNLQVYMIYVREYVKQIKEIQKAAIHLKPFLLSSPDERIAEPILFQRKQAIGTKE